MKYTLRSAGRFTTRTEYALHALLLALKELKNVRWRQCLCLGFLIGVYGIAIPYDAYQPEPTIIINEAHAEEATPPVEPPVVIEVTYTKERVKELIVEAFPESPNMALAIAKCESGYVADIQSQHTLSYGQERSFGVFQVHEPDWGATAKKLGLENWKTDAKENIQLARYIYEKNGWKPWSCYRMI